MSAPFKEHKQKELRDLIMEVLWRNPKLNYYQVCKVGRSDNGEDRFNTDESFLRASTTYVHVFC
jgi:hypothetical protein